jgi:hypothetical protein
VSSKKKGNMFNIGMARGRANQRSLFLNDWRLRRELLTYRNAKGTLTYAKDVKILHKCGKRR